MASFDEEPEVKYSSEEALQEKPLQEDAPEESLLSPPDDGESFAPEPGTDVLPESLEVEGEDAAETEAYEPEAAAEEEEAIADDGENTYEPEAAAEEEEPVAGYGAETEAAREEEEPLKEETEAYEAEAPPEEEPKVEQEEEVKSDEVKYDE